MQSSNYREQLIDFIRAQAKPPDKFSHQDRLHRLAVRLAEDKSFDDDILFAAAWLHDLGVFIGHRPEEIGALERWDHIAYAMKESPAILKRFGFPMEKISAVLEAIRTHMPSGEPQAYEGVLLRDADILEQIGAVGILRTVSKVGRDTRFITFGDALSVLQRNARELPSKLKLNTSRREGEARIRLLHAFIGAAQAETGDLPW